MISKKTAKGYRIDGFKEEEGCYSDLGDLIFDYLFETADAELRDSPESIEVVEHEFSENMIEKIEEFRKKFARKFAEYVSNELDDEGLDHDYETLSWRLEQALEKEEVFFGCIHYDKTRKRTVT